MARRRDVMGILGILVLGLAVGGAVRGPKPAPARSVTDVDKEVLEVREAAWRAWFNGDEKALGDLLPPEFIGIGAHGYEMSDRAKVLEASRAFKAAGGRLVSLSFADNHAQRYGDTLILYSRYDADIDTGKSQESMRGRATEIFVRRNGRWIHPGWHLDVQP